MNLSSKKPFLDQLINQDALTDSSESSAIQSNTTPGGSARDEYLGPSRHRLAYRPQMMVAFRQPSGEVSVFPYSHLCKIQSDDPTTSITLAFQAAEVVVTGSNLLTLFHYLCEHRIKEMIVADHSEFMEQDGDCVVTEINIRNRK